MQPRDVCNGVNFLLTMLPLMLSFNKQFALTQKIDVPALLEVCTGMNGAPNFPTQSPSDQIQPSTNKEHPKEKDSMWLPPRLWVGSFSLSLIMHIYNRKKSERQIPRDEK